jgi:hypothetical protein
LRFALLLGCLCEPAVVFGDALADERRFKPVEELRSRIRLVVMLISAIREKRALVSGLIEKLERKLEQHRADLTHIDGVLRLFQPDRDPGEIKPKRTIFGAPGTSPATSCRGSPRTRYGPQTAR